MESLTAELDQVGGLSEKHLEAQRRRDMEISKLRKDLEGANLAIETAESQMRKKHQTMLSDLQVDVEQLQKTKSK